MSEAHYLSTLFILNMSKPVFILTMNLRRLLISLAQGNYTNYSQRKSKKELTHNLH